MASSKRDHLIETALRLFYRGGFHRTGIDAILAEAGVAKMTLYKHFKSKEELILACLRRQDEHFRNDLMKRVEKHSKDPRERLLALFDIVGEHATSTDFCGCLFINAAAEYSEQDDPIHQAALEHKRLFYQYLTKLARKVGVSRGDEQKELASQIALLLEGATVSAQVSGQCSIPTARRAAQQLIENAIATPA